jgi:hypothetical protein
MRDFRDAKGRARALRDALKSKAIETTHAEALELVAKAFGYKNWQGGSSPARQPINIYRSRLHMGLAPHRGRAATLITS